MGFLHTDPKEKNKPKRRCDCEPELEANSFLFTSVMMQKLNFSAAV